MYVLCHGGALVNEGGTDGCVCGGDGRNRRRRVTCGLRARGYVPGNSRRERGPRAASCELRETNIVRSFRKLGSWQGASDSFSVPLKTPPEDAAAVAVLVQQRNRGPIIGAATGVLHESAQAHSGLRAQTTPI
jgi:hypothetical protein